MGTAHVIGNGESNSLYTPQSGTIMVCNIPKHNHPFDLYSIIDTRVIQYLMKEKLELLDKPVWGTQVVKDFAKKNKIKGEFLHVYENIHRYNSGHHAVFWLSKKYNEIHIWGFDSMWSDDLLSQMDDRVKRPKRPPLNKQWRPHWNNLFKKYPLVKYYIHQPTNTETVEWSKNVETIKS